jgi:membrane associated rhomboid family serine protease
MAVCYRHPNRETGVSCSNCGKPICPDCMTATPVGMRCPDCSRQRTPVRTLRSMHADPTITYVLIAINVLLFLGSTAGGSSFGSGGGGRVFRDLALYGPSIDIGHEYWRLVTAGFLHSGIAHLLFNMFALYVLGGLLEPAVGRLRFGLIYFVSLLSGSFGALVLEPTQPTLGASGAIFGLMGAGVVVMRNAGISPMESGLGLWILLNLIFTFAFPNISIGGHLGGLLGGALAALLLYDLRDRVRLPKEIPTALTIALGALAVVGSIAVSS